jgi:hypothetical protein
MRSKEEPLYRIISIITAFVILLSACTAAHRPGSEKPNGETPAADISGGLPAEGFWRQNIVLMDMNQDGFLDIVAPPPRKAKKEGRRPFIFLREGESGRWNEAPAAFPSLPDYDYGGVAAGDLNGDGLPDIVLAVHTGKLIVLHNTREGKFLESPFFVGKPFHSRTVKLSDINNDGWADIVALSEAAFNPSYTPAGILVGINRKGQGWDIRFVEGSKDLFGDSFALGDLNGDGNVDIVVTPLAAERQGKYVWFGDGRGGFLNYTGDFTGDAKVADVAAGDIDGDNISEIAMIIVSKLQPGDIAAREILVFKWANGTFENISKGFESMMKAYAFNFADIDGDRKQELIVLTEGIGIYQYIGGSWVRKLYSPIGTYQEMSGVYGIEAGRNADGSSCIAFNLGSENVILKRGIKAYAIRPGPLPN